MNHNFINKNFLQNIEIPQRVFDEYQLKGFSQFELPNYLKKYINELKDNIKSTNLAPTSIQYSGTERRFYSYQKSNDEIIKLFYLFGSALYFCLFKKRVKLNILAIDNLPINSDKDLYSRWHVDSRNFQFKLFIYLNDVSNENAPFQLLKNTHRLKDKLKIIIKHENFFGPYFGFNKIKNLNNFQCISDEFIEKISKKYPIHTFTGKAGTCFIANTSCIHRDSPCLKGYRSSLHYYYD